MTAKKETDPSDQNKTLYVGLGASAGGLETLKEFFTSLPEEPGMAFIVVVHLAPDYDSNMAELLQMQTSWRCSRSMVRWILNPITSM